MRHTVVLSHARPGDSGGWLFANDARIVKRNMWLHANAQPGWECEGFAGRVEYYFYNEKDALMFKMKFG